MAQETVFDDSCLQPFIDHPSDDAICDSLVEERAKMGVWDRVEILAYIDVNDPIEPLGPQIAPQRVERLMG